MADLSLWEHADHLASSRTDRFFRQMTSEWGPPYAADGDVEAPTGWFCMLQVVRAEVAEFAAQDGDPWITERRNLSLGWYAVIQDNLGFVYAFYYGEGDKARQALSEDFDKVADQYYRWETE